MSETTIKALAALVREAEAHRDAQSGEWQRAEDYAAGKMTDTPAGDGYSSVISRDLQATLNKVMPSLLRVILGSERVVEYAPNKQGTEAQADQATDYINAVVLDECGAHSAIASAAEDAAITKMGVLRWYQDERRSVQYSTHTGLDEMAVSALVQDGAEIVAADQSEAGITVQVKRTLKQARTVLQAVKRSEFLVSPDATSLDDAALVGIATSLTRSDLVAMGYDRALVERLAKAGDGKAGRSGDMPDSLTDVAYYELYVRIDEDDDGIAELRRIVFAGGVEPENMLENEPWDEVPFAVIRVKGRKHALEGHSISEMMMELQRIKTVLLRQTLDNLYWQNMPQPVLQEGVVQNPEAVFNPQFGKPIRIREGVSVRDAVQYNAVPFVAKESFAMLSYIDQEARERTGISDASSGLAPDALQNMTATASAMLESAGIAQTESMVRTLAHDLKRAFKGLLKLIVQHQDKPRTVRLRGEWVEFDPRSWDADMDCSVNTGLGAGSRERDMMAMQQVIGLQEKLLASMGADNPFVKPENVFNAIQRLVEAAGLKDVTPYFTKPDPQEVQQRLEAMRNNPTPEQMKAQAAMQVEEMKAKMAAEKEKAQAEADVIVNKQRYELAAQNEAQKLALKRYEIDERNKIEWARIGAQTVPMADPLADVDMGAVQ